MVSKRSEKDTSIGHDTPELYDAEERRTNDAVISRRFDVRAADPSRPGLEC